MLRLWGKIFKNNNAVNNKVITLNTSNSSLDVQVKRGLESLCYHFDISEPIWLSDNKTDFAMIGKTRFISHHFVESIDFDYLEIELIEDTKPNA